MNYRDKIRKAIECPQFGVPHYGEWGALRYDQRLLIKRLLDEFDSADNYIINLRIKHEQLKEKYKKALTMLSDYNCPCELDNFNTKEENIDYCRMNCSADTDIFIKCWDRYIEQSLRSDKNV